LTDYSSKLGPPFPQPLILHVLRVYFVNFHRLPFSAPLIEVFPVSRFFFRSPYHRPPPNSPLLGCRYVHVFSSAAPSPWVYILRGSPVFLLLFSGAAAWICFFYSRFSRPKNSAILLSPVLIMTFCSPGIFPRHLSLVTVLIRNYGDPYFFFPSRRTFFFFLMPDFSAQLTIFAGIGPFCCSKYPFSLLLFFLFFLEIFKGPSRAPLLYVLG